MIFNPDTDLLSAAMDRVIPPVDGLPGAGGMGLAEVVVEQSRTDDRFWEALCAVVNGLSSPRGFLSQDGEGQDEALRVVETSQPAAFGLWLDIVYTIYYMQPDVHRHLGWHGSSPQPDGNVMPPWDESVLSVTRKRKPFWRRV